ncbi:MAG: chaperone modulator CbpM [Terricaulis sp.]
MTFATAEFLVHTQLDRQTLDVWIEEGWLIPGGTEVEQLFYEADLARAQLIRDLIEDLGVNTEGVGIVLNLLDQLHGLRSALAHVFTAASDNSPT